MSRSGLSIVVLVGVCAAVLVGLVALSRRRQPLVSANQSATFEILHAANLLGPLLRKGFDAESLERAAPNLRTLLGVPGVAVVDSSGVLGYDGPDHHHADCSQAAQFTLQNGSREVLDLNCSHEDCAVSKVLSLPVVVGNEVIGALVAVDASASPGLVRSMNEVASWVSSQVELGRFDEHRARLARAELRALRAQISPHFIYNALTAIASFTRTDSERARELLLEFADFTRYSLSSHGEFTTVSEELRCIERYLSIEQARFGNRLHVRLQVAPEVLPVSLPFLVLQPLVENAVRHGIEGRASSGVLEIIATDTANDCVITIEDNGVGVDPSYLQRVIDGHPSESDHIGLQNVDERLRTVFGPAYGLSIETAQGAGTKVTVRVPKFRAGVRP